MTTNKDKKDGGGAWGMLGGVAVGAAVVYGAYKIFRTVTGYGKPSEDTNMDSVQAVHTKRNKKLTRGCEKVLGVRNLNEALLVYCKDYVDVSGHDIEEADSVVSTFTNILTLFLKNHCPKTRFGQLIKTGDCVEGLHVIRADHYTLTMPLVLDRNMWTVVDGATTLHNMPEYWLVKRINTEFFEAKSNVWDDFCVGDYLSPVKVKRALQAALQKGLIDWSAKYQMQFSLILLGSSITVHIEYGDNRKLFVELMPTVVFDNVCIVAQPHPKVSSNVSFENLWLQSHFELERFTIRNMDHDDLGCRLQCLKICKSVYLNNSALQVVDFAVFKAVFFMINEGQPDWREVKLADRFMDIFQQLENVLRCGYLKNYFGQSRNLVEGCLASDSENVLFYLNGIVSRNKYNILLDTRKY